MCMNPLSTRTGMRMGRCVACKAPIEIWDHSTPRKHCNKICRGVAKRKRTAERKERVQ